MRSVVVVCDECGDEADETARRATVKYDNGASERLDLCDFCAGEIAGARQDTETYTVAQARVARFRRASFSAAA